MNIVEEIIRWVQLHHRASQKDWSSINTNLNKHRERERERERGRERMKERQQLFSSNIWTNRIQVSCRQSASPQTGALPVRY